MDNPCRECSAWYPGCQDGICPKRNAWLAREIPGIAQQPAPVDNDGADIAALVIRDIEARAQMGKEIYGVRLKTDNGRDAELDAYQEALDLVFYFRQRLAEREELTDVDT